MMKNKFQIFDEFVETNVYGKKLVVCDLGCGGGNTINFLKKKSKLIYGLDVDKDSINKCKTRFKEDMNVKIRLASASDTGLKSSSFDYVILQKGLHHMKEKEKVLEEIHRILKDKGKFILIDKYYKNLIKYYAEEGFRLLIGDKHIIGHYVRSKKYNESIIKKKFRLIKENLIKDDSGEVTKEFMKVLTKRTNDIN